MHEGNPYGHLKVGNKVILPENLARMVGVTIDEIEGLLEELLSAEVYSVDEDGCIFSRRMVKDEKVRAARAAGGSKGGNPALMKEEKGAKDNDEVRGKVRGKVETKVNLNPTPSSSSSSSSSKNIPPSEGADAPSSSTTVWDVWLSVAGHTNQNRSFLGKLIKTHGEDAVMDAVLKTRTKQPAEPKQYILGVLNASANSKPDYMAGAI